jgi:hypothetical protein
VIPSQLVSQNIHSPANAKHSESHRFTEDGFDKNNGANGKLPITPREWRLVGISSDMDAYRLMKYLYGFQLNSHSFSSQTCFQLNSLEFMKEPYENCMHVLAPSTLKHIAEKFLQLAATNNTDGGHHNPFNMLKHIIHVHEKNMFFRDIFFPMHGILK